MSDELTCAYHEAGHVLLAHKYFSSHISYVTIEPACYMYFTISGCVRFTCTVDDLISKSLRGFMCLTLAGDFSTMLFLGKSELVTDYIVLSDLLVKHKYPVSSYKSILNRISLELVNYLQDNKNKVEALVTMLMSQKHIDYSYLSAMLDS